MRLKYRVVQIWLVLSIGLLGSVPQSFAMRSAEEIFAAIEPSVFQIQIIESKSASQVALGTGFMVEGGLVATNYHVVSDVVLDPNKHTIEIEIEDIKYNLNVVSVDVINDLALLRPVDTNFEATPFKLATKDAKQGAILYSLGNPHNIGMTVVQGNYNGFAEHSFLERIHFSGAVNSGMSGGPTVNEDAEVVGINVASAGNQIGFLVPVKHLKALLGQATDDVQHEILLERMAAQISAHTSAMVDAFISQEWPTETMGRATILGQVVDWMDCWGDSNDNIETGVTEIARGCNNADNVFLSSSFNTGFFEYEYFYKEAPDWPEAAFYRHWRLDTASAVAGNHARKKQVTNFKCENELVVTHAETEFPMTRKVSYCVRAYKKLPGLFDVFFIGVSTDKANAGVMDHFTLSGVTQKAAQDFLVRYLEVLSWQS